MAKSKYDWGKLREEYAKRFKNTGLSVAEFARSKGLRPDTVRRHIKQSDYATEVDETTGEKVSPVDSSRSVLGRFLKGNKVGLATRYQEGNRANYKHGAYAKNFDEELPADTINKMTLFDELELVRNRLGAVMAKVSKIDELFAEADSVEEKLKLLRLQTDNEQLVITLTGRVESLEKTIVSIEHAQIVAMRDATTADKNIAQTELAKQEKERREREAGSDDNKVVFNLNW